MGDPNEDVNARGARQSGTDGSHTASQDGGHQETDWNVSARTFDLRDYFAGQALASGTCRDDDYAGTAERCYAMADAMLAEKCK